MNQKELIEKGLLAFIGLSLSVNAYLIKNQVSEVTASIKELNETMTDVKISQAVVRKQSEIHENWLTSYQGRIQYLEARVERFNTILEKGHR